MTPVSHLTSHQAGHPLDSYDPAEQSKRRKNLSCARFCLWVCPLVVNLLLVWLVSSVRGFISMGSVKAAL
ncbi:MAG: hypothetical protein V4671_05990, partial [Armatimonadota bacterium]